MALLTTSNIPSGWNRTNIFVVNLTVNMVGATTYWNIDGGDSGTGTQFTVTGQGGIIVHYHSVLGLEIEAEKTQTLMLDNVTPVTTLTAPTPDGTNGWYITNPTMSLSATDETSGVSVTLYRWDYSTWNNYTIPFQMPTTGIHVLQFYSIDDAGNGEGINTYTFSYDDVAPVTQDDAPEGLQKTEVTVHFFYSDNLSGVVKTYYTKDGSVPTLTSPSGSEVKLSESGNYIIRYFSVDYAGNQESVKTSSVQISIDTSAPNVSISESFSINGSHGWWRTTPDITLSATDPSGIAAIKYQLAPTGVTTTAKYTGTIDLTNSVNLSNVWLTKISVDGGTAVEIDLRGSVPAATQISEIISAINNAIGVAVATETGADGNIGLGYVTITSPTAGVSTAKVEFTQPTATDANSIVFGLNTTYPHTYEESVYYKTFVAPITLPFDGKWTLLTYAIDGEGNQGEPITKLYQLDSITPSTSATASFDPDGNDGWYKTQPEITLTATDTGSGVWRSFYQWDTGNVYEYTGVPFNIPSLGTHNLNYYSIDIAGNIAGFSTTPFKFDNVSPITTDDSIIYTASSENFVYISGEHPTVLSSKSIRLTNYGLTSIASIRNYSKGTILNPLIYRFYAVEPIYGYEEIEIYPYIEEDATIIDTNTLQVTKNNIKEVVRIFNGTTEYVVQSISGYLITVAGGGLTGTVQVSYSYDGVGLSTGDNIEVDYYYNKLAETNIAFNKYDRTFITPYSSPKIFDHDVTITLSVFDIFSGADKTYYTTDGSTPTTSSFEGTSILLNVNGTYTIKYFSVDHAGNIESPIKTALYQIIIDKDIPVVNFYFDKKPDGTNEWYVSNFGFLSDIYTDNVNSRIHAQLSIVNDYYTVKTGVNDVIQWNDGVDHTGIIPSIVISTGNNKIDFAEGANVYSITIPVVADYTPEDLSTTIQSLLNLAGGSTDYLVTFDKQRYLISKGAGSFKLLWLSGVNQANSAYQLLGFYKTDTSFLNQHLSTRKVKTRIDYSIGDLKSKITALTGYDIFDTNGKFTIEITYLSFSLLWNTGDKKDRTCGYLLGFDCSSDDTGSSTYTSDWYRFRATQYNDHFFKSFTSIKTISDNDLTLHRIEECGGTQGFYNEILVSGTYVYGENVYADYTCFTGMDRIAYALDSQTLTNPVITLRNNAEYFEELNLFSKYVGSIPITIIDLSANNKIKIEIDQSNNPVEINLSGIIPTATTITEIVNNINTQLGQTVAHRTDIDGNIDIAGSYVSIISNETETISEIVFYSPSQNDATPLVFGLNTYPYVASKGPKYRVVFTAVNGEFYVFEGEHTIFGNAYDWNSPTNTGIENKESGVKSVNFNLDKTVPITIDDTTPPVYKTSEIITITPTDVYSGIFNTYYTLDGSIPTVNSSKLRDIPDGKLHFTTTGTYVIKYFSIDEAGNQESVKTASNQVWIDASPPVTLLSTSPANPDGQNGWFVTPPAATLSVIEIPGQEDKTYYRIGDYSFQEYVAPFALTTEGINVIDYYSIDKLGNTEEIKESIIKIDTVKPVTTTNIPITGYSNKPTVEFYIFDTASGGSTTYYTIDGTTPTTSSFHGSYAPQTPFQSSGTYIIKYFSVDVAGNEENVKTETLNLDIEVPIIDNFIPADGIVDESTMQITFHLKDDLSGVDISSAVFEVDGIEYSTTKNSSYFNYTGTPADYLVTILPVHGVLNFEDIKLLRVRNVKDFAGNEATPLVFDFSTRDIKAPRIRELNPIPNSQDVSTETNIIAYLTDDQSGVDIRSVVVTINNNSFKIVSGSVIQVAWTGNSLSSAKISIQNNYFTSTVNGVLDLSFSFLDVNYDTIKKVSDYIDANANYSCQIIESKYEQYKSINLLTELNVDINSSATLDLFIPENNLNFAYIERENGYLVFVTPNYSFEHKVIVNVRITASDIAGNAMSYAYAFIPNKTAWWPVWKRNWLNKDALTYIKDIQTYIPSNYTRSQSTNFYGHHKAIGLELARIREDIDHLFEDAQYTTVRPQYLWQKLGYLLNFDPQAIFSHDDYRRILLSLVQIFFEGSTKNSLTNGVALFTQSDVKIIENVFQQGSDISDQFTFSIDVLLGDSRLIGLDLQAITDNINLVMDMTRPAHTYMLLRYIWTEMFNFQAGCDPIWLLNEYGQAVLDQFGDKIPVLDDDGFQQFVALSATAICDAWRMEQSNFLTEDVRTNCQGHDEEIISAEEDVSIQFTGVEDTFETCYKPILSATPVVWPNNQLAILTTDVIVTVNGLPVVVSEIDPELGIIKLAITPTAEDVVVIHYHWNPYYIYRHITGYLNNYVTLGNDFDTAQGTIFNTFNVNDYLGGFQHDERLHAPVCETFVEYIIEDAEGEQYEMPPCQDGERFLLNNYTISGINFIDNQSFSSYLNNIDDIGFSAECGFVEIAIDELEKEILSLPDANLTEFIIDGRIAGGLVAPPSSFYLFGNSTTTGILNDPGYVLIGQEGLTYDRYETKEIVADLTDYIIDGREIGNFTYENIKAQIWETGFILNSPLSILNNTDDILVPNLPDESHIEIVETETEIYSDITETENEFIIDGTEVGNFSYEDVKSQIWEKYTFILNESLLNGVGQLVPLTPDQYWMEEILPLFPDSYDGASDLNTSNEITNVLAEGYDELSDNNNNTIDDFQTDVFSGTSDAVSGLEIVLIFSENVKDQLYNKTCLQIAPPLINTMNNANVVLAPYSSDTYTATLETSNPGYRSETFKSLFRFPFIQQ